MARESFFSLLVYVVSLGYDGKTISENALIYCCGEDRRRDIDEDCYGRITVEGIYRESIQMSGRNGAGMIDLLHRILQLLFEFQGHAPSLSRLSHLRIPIS
jgi:hypothetical protein